MAYVQKLKGSRLTYRITVSHNGKRYTTTYHPEAGTAAQIGAEVRRAADRYEAEVKSGLPAGQTRTLEQYVRETWLEAAQGTLTPGQVEQYVAVLNSRILPVIGHLTLPEVTVRHVQRLIDTMASEGLKTATVRKYMCALASVIQYALDMGVVAADPMQRARYPRDTDPRRKHAWTPEQCQSFLDFLRAGYTLTDSLGRETEHKVDHKWFCYFLLSVYGSFRRGELVALQWQDINTEACTITIQRAVQRARGQVIVKTPKTKAGIRTVSIPADVIKALMQLPHVSEYVFVRGGTVNPGAMLYPTSPSKQFRQLLKAYNTTHRKTPLPVISLHDLRHTGITILLEHGVGIETVKRRAGHSRASVTLDVYGESYDKTDRQAAATLQRVLMGGDGNDDRDR